MIGRFTYGKYGPLVEQVGQCTRCSDMVTTKSGEKIPVCKQCGASGWSEEKPVATALRDRKGRLWARVEDVSRSNERDENA